MKKFIYPFGVLLLFLMNPQVLTAQCTTNDATDCECEDPSQNDCDLLPDIQVSWYGLLNVSDGPSEYSQDYNGSDAGRLRISVSTPNDGYGPLTVRGVDDNGWAYFICGGDTLIDYDPSSNLSGYYCDDSSALILNLKNLKMTNTEYRVTVNQKLK